MPAKKTSSRSAKKARPAPSQLQQLRATVEELRKRVSKEIARGRKNSTLLREAERTRARFARQVTELRTKGSKLAAELKKTLSESGRAQKAREEALARIATLREELSRRTDELRRKSSELSQLARESAERARDIIVGHEDSSSGTPPTVGQRPSPEHEDNP